MNKNKKKYILDVSSKQRFQNKLKELPSSTAFEIMHGALADSCSIRSQVDQKTGAQENSFTYQNKINGNLIAIKAPLSDSDFASLWIKVIRVINKISVQIVDNDLQWQVDFFKSSNMDDYYLVMASVELLDGFEEPPTIPDFVENNLLYAVEKDDKRFDNFKLGSPQSIVKLIEKLKNGK